MKKTLLRTTVLASRYNKLKSEKFNEVNLFISHTELRTQAKWYFVSSLQRTSSSFSSSPSEETAAAPASTMAAADTNPTPAVRPRR